MSGSAFLQCGRQIGDRRRRRWTVEHGTAANRHFTGGQSIYIEVHHMLSPADKFLQEYQHVK